LALGLAFGASSLLLSLSAAAFALALGLALGASSLLLSLSAAAALAFAAAFGFLAGGSWSELESESAGGAFAWDFGDLPWGFALGASSSLEDPDSSLGGIFGDGFAVSLGDNVTFAGGASPSDISSASPRALSFS